MLRTSHLRSTLFPALIATLLVGCAATSKLPGNASSDASANVDEVAAWEAFCDELKAVGAATLREHPQQHGIDRAEGVRYLAQQIGAAVDLELIGRDRAFPLLRLGATTIDKWGLDGADAKYQGAPLDGSGTYRLTGTLGNARLIAVQLARILPKYAAYDSLTGSDFAADAEGRFDVLLSNERPADWTGRWLRLDPEATSILVREYFEDWENSENSTFRIERVDSVPRQAPLAAKDIQPMLGRIAQNFEERVPMWLNASKQTRRFLTNRSRTTATDDATDSASTGLGGGQGLSDNVYGVGWFAVEPGKAVVIEFEKPQALLWSIQLGNYWWESIDYVTGTGSLNGHQAFTNGDGRVRVVVAMDDPGVPNWLDPAGHPEGMFLYRFQRATRSSEPEIRVVDASELRRELPADTPRISREQRAAEIAVRRAHATRRWTP